MSTANAATATRPGIPWRQKLIAAGAHLTLSAVAFCVLLWVAMRVWYPDFMFVWDGGWRGLQIVVPVDLVLGPLLTFVVFRLGKPGLATDLTLILLLQVAAFAAGTWTMWHGRPMAVVFADGKFYGLSAEDYQTAGLRPPDLGFLPGTRPHWVVVALPTDLEAQSELRARLFRARQPLYTYSQAYSPLSEHLAWVSAYGIPQKRFAKMQPLPALQDWLARSGRDASELAVLPYSGRYRSGLLVFDRGDGRLLRWFPVPEDYRFPVMPLVARAQFEPDAPTRVPGSTTPGTTGMETQE